MYLRGQLTISLTGKSIELSPPSHFFGGIANLLTQGRWQTKEEMETYKLLAFTQCAHQALAEMDVDNVVRVSIGSDVLYEDWEKTPDDLALAMQALQQRVSRGHEADPHSEFDMVLQHDDEVLNYVIDLDFVREHTPGVDPVTIKVAAVPSEFQRGKKETYKTYQQRIQVYFDDQARFDETFAQWETLFISFLNSIADRFRAKVDVEHIQIETWKVLPRERDASALKRLTQFGAPLYGYNEVYDLVYLKMWDELWGQRRVRRRETHASDAGGSGTDEYHGTVTHSDPAFEPGGGQFSGGGASHAWADSSHSSGSGGWLDSISDFFSGDGGDSGNGGNGGGNGGGD